MATYKIGDGTYASPTVEAGYTFTLNPRISTITTKKKVDQIDWDLQDFNVVLDKGAIGGTVTIEGEFTAQSDVDDLRKACTYTRYLSTNEVDMYYEKKFWHKSTRFMRVKGAQFDRIRTGLRTLMYPYRVNLMIVDIFEYDDTENSYTQASSGGAATVASVANAGDVYALPTFEVDVTSGTITKVVITYNGQTITWNGSITGTQRIRIDQLIQQSVTFATTSTSTPSSYKSYAGLMSLAAGASGTSFVFALTGGQGTCRVKVRPRYF